MRASPQPENRRRTTSGASEVSSPFWYQAGLVLSTYLNRLRRSGFRVMRVERLRLLVDWRGRIQISSNSGKMAVGGRTLLELSQEEIRRLLVVGFRTGVRWELGLQE